MDASEYNLYPIVTRDRSGAPVSGVPAPELNYEVESVIGGSWVRDDMEAQMRQWLVKQTNLILLLFLAIGTRQPSLRVRSLRWTRALTKTSAQMFRYGVGYDECIATHD